MSITQDITTGPWPWETPADVIDDADAFDDALYEARACGDPAYRDRMHSWWHPETDQPLPTLDQLLPTPPEDLDNHAGNASDDTVRVPADPLARHGHEPFLTLAARAKNQADAAYLAAIHQTGHTHGRYTTRGHPRRDTFATAAIGAALEHSTTVAASELRTAEAIIDRLPTLYEAMAAGWLDLIKAKTLIDATAAMPNDLAAMVTAHLLPRVPTLAKNTLTEHIEITAAQLDPDWTRRREQHARSRGRVDYIHNPTGTGDIALRDLSADTHARIHARADDLAHPLRRAARHLGLPLGLPALRLLISQRLLDGTYPGHDDHTLLTALTDELPAWHAELTATHEPPNADGPNDGGPDDGGSHDGGPDDGGPDDGGPHDGGPHDGGPDDGGPDNRPDDDGPDDGGPDGLDGDPEDPSPDHGDSPDHDPDGDLPGNNAADHQPVDHPPGEQAPREAGVRLGTVELRMRLSTALGLDELPGTIPGTGPITAPNARRMLHHIRRGHPTGHDDIPTEYRLVLVDDHGFLEHVLLIRPDPPHQGRRHHRSRSPRGPATPRGTVHGTTIVELAAPTTMLTALHPDDHPDWTRYLQRATTELAALATLATHGADLDGPNHPATTTNHAHHRQPGAALERFVRVRDRHCIGPAHCTRTAHHAEIDHTRDWAHFGLTVAANLSPPCKHCHALKHRGRWNLTQPRPGRFQWTSPLGATYTVEPRPVLDTPLPASPRANGRPRPLLDRRRPPRPNDTGHRTRRPPLTAPDEIPAPPGNHRHRVPDDDPPPF